MVSTYTKVGLVLIVLSIIVLYLSVSSPNQLPNSILSGAVSLNRTVVSHGFTNVSITIKNASVLNIFVAVSNSTNVYLMNSTAYGQWGAYMGAKSRPTGGLAYALANAQSGVFYIYQNATGLVSIPYYGTSTGTRPPVVYPQAALPFAPGTYYLVIDNTNGSASASQQVKVHIEYLQPISNQSLKNGELSSEYAQINQGIIYGVLFLALLAVGLCILFYGYIRRFLGGGAGEPKEPIKKGSEDEFSELMHKRKKAQQKKEGEEDTVDGMPRYIANAYKNVEKKHRRE